MGIRLVLIEDNRLLRDGLTAMINAQADLEVVAAAGNGENIVERLQQWQPHVVLLDLGLRTQNSLRLVELIRSAHVDVKIIVMDLIPAQEEIVDFIEAGVSGFLVKDATFDDFLGTIRAVAGGAKVLPSPLTGSLFSQIAAQAVRTGMPIDSDSVRMTRREREIIQLISDGMSNKEIAHRLNIATHTVKSHVHNILEKLALHSRLQLASYYARDKKAARVN